MDKITTTTATSDDGERTYLFTEQGGKWWVMPGDGEAYPCKNPATWAKPPQGFARRAA
jgi:hypothetical protein